MHFPSSSAACGLFFLYLLSSQGLEAAPALNATPPTVEQRDPNVLEKLPAPPMSLELPQELRVPGEDTPPGPVSERNITPISGLPSSSLSHGKLPLLPSGEPPKLLENLSEQGDVKEFSPGSAPEISRQVYKGEEKLIIPPKKILSQNPLGDTPLDMGKGPHKLSPDGLIHNLWDALAFARMNNPDLRIAILDVNRSVEQYVQAGAENRPRISMEGRNSLRGVNRHSTQTPLPYSSKTQDISQTDSTYNDGSLLLTLEQNIFNGGGTLARMKKTQQLIKASLAALDSKEQNVMKSVVDAYIKVVMAQITLSKQKMIENYNAELLQETQARYDLGGAKLSDVSVAQARLSSSSIDVRAAEADIYNSRAQLVILCGTNLAERVTMPEPYNKIPDTVEDLQKVSFQYYPDILQAKFEEFAALHSISDATSKFLPSLDISASTGPRYDSSFSDTTKAVLDENLQEVNSRQKGLGNSMEFGVNVVAVIPIYSRGVNASVYRDSQQALKQKRLAVEKTRRDVFNLCQNYFNSFQASKENVTSCKIWLENSSIALQSATLENELGERELISLLQIQDDWSKAYSAYIQIMADLIRNSYYLLSLEGKLNAKYLHLDVQTEDILKYYEDNRDAWFTLGQNEEETRLFTGPLPKEKTKKTQKILQKTSGKKSPLALKNKASSKTLANIPSPQGDLQKEKNLVLVKNTLADNNKDKES